MTVHRLHKVKRQNQQGATTSMFIITLLSQHVSGIIMSIIRRTRPCINAYGVLLGCVGCGLVELRREQCALCESLKCDNKHRITCILLVLSLQPTQLTFNLSLQRFSTDND